MSESITITIKSSGDKKYELTFDPTITVAELKNLVAEKAEIPAASQRLIYSGKVLKDGETVASYKVQNGHTIHLVRSAGAGSSSGAAAASPSTANASTTAANTSSTAPPNTANASSVPSNIAAGQGSFNPLADLTGARYAGYSQLPSASMFGPDGGMNSNLPDPDQLNSMMSNPMFQQQMQAMLSDPQMLDFMIQQNPQLRAMGPQVREMLQSPFFRQMISNPQMMRSMMEMNRGNAAAQSAFPAPGANPAATGDAAAGENATTGDNANANAGAAGAGAAAANPFAGLFPNGVPPIDPLALFGGAAPAAPVDNRPPEERYENQLRQLNDMGFYDFDRNVEALRRTGGSVQGAIEYLLGGN